MDFREGNGGGVPVAEVQAYLRLLQLWQEGILPAVGAIGSRMPANFSANMNISLSSTFRNDRRSPKTGNGTAREPTPGNYNSKKLRFWGAIFQKTFLLFMDECRLCEKCPGSRSDCKNLQLSRTVPKRARGRCLCHCPEIGFSDRGADRLQADDEPVFVLTGSKLTGPMPAD